MYVPYSLVNAVLYEILFQRFRFPSPVLKVQFHPRNENILLVVPMKHAPVVVNVATGTHRQEEKIQMFSPKFPSTFHSR